MIGLGIIVAAAALAFCIWVLGRLCDLDGRPK